MATEKRFGGSAAVKLDTIQEILVAKMQADARDLIALLSRAETMGEFEEQQRLLAEFQASHRALHVIKGTLTVKGETILIAPPVHTELGDTAAQNTGILGVGQALDLGKNGNGFPEHSDDQSDQTPTSNQDDGVA